MAKDFLKKSYTGWNLLNISLLQGIGHEKAVVRSLTNRPNNISTSSVFRSKELKQGDFRAVGKWLPETI